MAEWYVSSWAGGGGDGSILDPWTLAEMFVAIQGGAVANGDRCNVKADGTYTSPNVTLTRDGLLTAWVRVQGYNSTIGDGGRATIQRQAGEVGGWMVFTGANYYVWRDLVFDGNNVGNGTSEMWRSSSATNLINCELKNANNLHLFYGANATNCYIHGLIAGGNNTAYACRLYNCLVRHTGGQSAGATIYEGVNTIFKNESASAWAYSLRNPYFIYGCVMDGCGDNCAAGALDPYYYPIMNSVFMNMKNSGQNRGISVNCDYWNIEVVDYGPNVIAINPYDVDPQFNDPANLDYRRTGSNLDDLGFSTIGLQTPDYGIDIGPDQGKFTIPVIGNVRDGVTVGRDANPGTGVLDLPAVTDVEDGVIYDNTTKEGTFEAPAEAEVLDGVGYGAGGTEYEGNVELPAVGDVEDGVAFGPGGASEGTFEAPDEGDVEDGVGYGAGGTEFEGNVELPDEDEVKAGTEYGAEGDEFEGTLDTIVLQTAAEVEVAEDGLILDVEVEEDPLELEVEVASE